MTCRAAAICIAWCCSVLPGAAHEGPPYPILVDEPVEDFLVSVWGDPDVGTGTFYVIFEADDAVQSSPTLPRVELWAQPVTGRLEKVTYSGRPERHNQFRIDPQFDREEPWMVGVVMHFPDGAVRELTAQVDVTPPGYGRWDLVIYLLPFLLFGGLWSLTLLRRWRQPRPRTSVPIGKLAPVGPSASVRKPPA